jgi:hypothetical protein
LSTSLRLRIAPLAILLAVPLLYPVAVLGRGAPRFPSRADCVEPAGNNGKIDAVFGRFATQAQASIALRRVLELGFSGSEVEADGCGLQKVLVHGIPNLEVGHELVEEARGVGLHVRLERGQG